MSPRTGVLLSIVALACAPDLWARPALLNASNAVAVVDEDEPVERRLKIDHLLDWESVSSPQLRADGAEIVFTRTWADKIEDRSRSALWIMNADGTHPRFLTDGSQARWSPDGHRIAFVKEGEPKGSQIHVMWRATREVTQITRVDQSPSNIRWSPDGTQISFTSLVPASSDFLPIKMPKAPKGASWAAPPRIVTRLSYRRDRSGYRPNGYRHLFVVDAEGGTPHQVTDGDYDHGGGEWLPDGEHLVFSGLREEDADWKLRESAVYRVHLETGDITQLTNRPGPDFGPLPSPDGQTIAYYGYDKNDDSYTVPELYVMDADGSNPRSLTKNLDRRPSNILWAETSDRLFFNVDSQGTRHLFEANLYGQLSQHSWGDIVFSASDIGPNSRIVGTATASDQPTDIASIQLLDGFSADVSLLTDVNRDLLRHVDLASQEEIWVSSVDDFQIQGWVVKPPGFDPDKKYPLILQIHGGPHAMYNVGFSFERQNHAAEDYVVLYVNPRGSTGYGKAFGNAIKNDYPNKDYLDLMACVDHVVAQGSIDEDNLFVYGGSGGGVLTCWIVGHTDRFKSAVSMFPVTNWISFVGTTDGPYWYSNFEKLPWEDITEHWNRSPLKYVGNVTTPTLLLTGELDLRTPMAQTEEFYQALKLRKVDTAMIRIADEYHGAAGRHYSNRLRRILYVREWFEKYRNEEGEAAGTATGG